MAGSKQRSNVQGHTVVAHLEDIRYLRRLGSGELSQIFLQAKEQGQVRVTLNDRHYTLQRHSDHTFTLESGDQSHSFLA